MDFSNPALRVNFGSRPFLSTHANRESISLGEDILKSVTETVSALEPSVQQKVLPQLHSLEGEKNEAFLLESLLNLGIRLKSAKQDASAALLLQRLSQTDLPQDIRERAKGEYGAMIGSGAPCLRAEYFFSCK